MKIRSISLIFIFSIAIPVLFASCASTGLPKANERTTIQSGKQTLVLLRITCESEDGKPVEPFFGDFSPDNINIGSANNFIIGGMVKRVEFQRFLSPETKEQGWIYLIVEPGMHYFVFQGPQTADAFTFNKQLRYLPRWQVNLPQNNAIVYIGTMHLCCGTVKDLFSGKKRCISFDERRMAVRDEELLAKNIVEEYLKDFGSFKKILMKRF